MTLSTVLLVPELPHDQVPELPLDQEALKRILNRQRPADYLFLFGLLNIVLVSWMFGAHPEHMWVLYICEAIPIFLIRLKSIASEKDMFLVAMDDGERRSTKMIRILFFLDFCYIYNFFGLAMAVTKVLGYELPLEAEVVFGILYLISVSLLGASTFFGDKFIFHDVDNTCSMLVHFFPSLVMYTLRWHWKTVNAHWPGLFSAGPFGKYDLFSLWLYAVCFYFTWLITYTVIMLAWLKCASREKQLRYDTIFQWNLRENVYPALFKQEWLRSLLCRRRTIPQMKEAALRSEFTICPEFLMYLVIHAAMNFTGITVALLMYTHQTFNVLAIVVALLSTFYRGTSKYSQWLAIQKDVSHAVRSA